MPSASQRKNPAGGRQGSRREDDMASWGHLPAAKGSARFGLLLIPITVPRLSDNHHSIKRRSRSQPRSSRNSSRATEFASSLSEFATIPGEIPIVTDKHSKFFDAPDRWCHNRKSCDSRQCYCELLLFLHFQRRLTVKCDNRSASVGAPHVRLSVVGSQMEFREGSP